MEGTQQCIQTQEKAHACLKFWSNLKGKHVESYDDLTLGDLYIHCKNLYEQRNIGRKMYYSSLSTTLSLFNNEINVCMRLKKLSSSMDGDIQGL